MFRIGTGYDVHRLVEGRQLILGGVKIPYEKGLLGHSDADVLIHSIIDSLLGATNLGDIGVHFPDNDLKFKDISSLELLKTVRNLIQETGYKISNIDATIIVQEPRIRPYIETMKINISTALAIGIEQINIKATTEEGLGFTGKREGIAANSSALIYRKDK
ncbi:MAG: 2-C-methyl-D-erythritol 2,4-cyclodiphosphate synthase [Candidatus Epulonipiscioides saccharophilum]|nr:MAG: 2-C-methyl-D-erythritol 2,4-cyclodiphosphate synthase [Epulopiscium sp. AS2M-Bin001]